MTNNQLAKQNRPQTTQGAGGANNRNLIANNYLQPESNLLLPEPQLYDQNGLFDDYNPSAGNNYPSNSNQQDRNPRGRNKTTAPVNPKQQPSPNPVQFQTTPKGSSLFTLPKQQPPERHPQSQHMTPGNNKHRGSLQEHTLSPPSHNYPQNDNIQVPRSFNANTNAHANPGTNNNLDANFQHMTKEEIEGWKVQSEEDLHVMSQKHEQLIGVILAEEEDVISLHRQHIDDTVELIKQVSAIFIYQSTITYVSEYLWLPLCLVLKKRRLKLNRK